MQAGMNEFQLQAIYEGESKFLGAQRQGFPPIIAVNYFFSSKTKSFSIKSLIFTFLKE